MENNRTILVDENGGILMNWDEYKKILSYYIEYIYNAKLLTYYSIPLFENFPVNFPDEIKIPIINEMMVSTDSLLNMAGTSESGGLHVLDKRNSYFTNTYYILLNTLINFGRIKEESCEDIFNFKNIILYQALVTNYSRIDAFYNDTIKSICKICPQIALNLIDDEKGKNDISNIKSMTWKQIIEYGNYENIVQTIIDEFSYRLGLKSISKRVTFLKEKLKLNIDINNDELKIITKGEKYRHCIIHRGGIADKKLTEEVNDKKLVEGKELPIDFLLLDNVFSVSEKLILSIFKEVSIKYFGKSKDDKFLTPYKVIKNPDYKKD
ncbi:hypothetical protein [Clostridium ljungdahlii]|uniref:Uncharacterized protein n=1 Tax=Clostridium ljungdahlii TaxID=1538 RepID=A0A166S145_9CLOT|nr:hypothetical protein [Clostridium ljungdahlii]OAA91463.1 hypothetical protein WY13_00720 [Clostridium ljungdahlii]